MDDFITFRKFTNLEEAGVLAEMLQKNNIEYELSEEKPSEDILFAGNTMMHELILKLRSEDFEAAEKLLEDIEEVKAENLDKDYYLFEFSDSELTEILHKPDEWSLNDYHWAREILRQRGNDTDDETIALWKKERIEFLSRTDEVTLRYLLMAYFFCIAGGFIGIFMGRHLSSSRKLLPNGQKVYAFEEKDRRKGYIISLAGLIFLVIWIILLFLML